MDVIYTDALHIDTGVLVNPIIDFEVGGSESFTMTLSVDDPVIEFGAFCFSDGSEIFGIVDNRKVDTASGSVTYGGRTIRGIFATKIVTPPSGQDYRFLTGNLITICNTFMSDFGISSVVRFTGSSISMNNYKVNRYISFLEMLDRILIEKNKKMSFLYENGIMNVTIENAIDYSNDVEYGTNSDVDFSIYKASRYVNHLICLGSGDLAQRQTAHLYIGSDGKVTSSRYYTGLNEIVEIFDYPNAESMDELINAGTERLEETITNTIDVGLTGNEYDLGDYVGGKDPVSNESISERITGKIIKISSGELFIDYKVGVNDEL